MLRVKISLKNGEIVSLEAQGHTYLSPQGTDVACAGASALIQGAVLGCTRHLGIPAGIEQDEGYLYFCLPDNLEGQKASSVQAVLESALLGLEEIQARYPAYLSITRVNL